MYKFFAMAHISQIQNNEEISRRQLIELTAKLSTPAILAQLSSILMQYIDAAMVGRLGAEPSAAIGLVSTSQWLFWGVCSAMTAGFTVQVAHKIGAKDYGSARSILRQSFVGMLIFSTIIAIIGVAISFKLPHWLGGSEAICHMASVYFLIFVIALPGLTISFLCGGMLRCAGNMKIPSLLSLLMALLDVGFNFFLIFPTRVVEFWGFSFWVPGADLGIAGAALGTVAAEILTAALMLYFLVVKEPGIALKGTEGSYRLMKPVIRKALKISAPMTLAHAVICGAQIVITIIVAPLGVVAIAANAFAVTAESLCYMPGYGISDAATTLVGQSYGAGRKQLARHFGYVGVASGMIVMSLMGLLMWVGADFMMKMMSPVEAISSLGAEILRIEAWAEPMFAAAIVSYGVFIGAGDTLIPACMNFSSIWLVRVPTAAILAPKIGLKGVWIAMCVELIFRGTIFLIRLFGKSWLNEKNKKTKEIETEAYEDNLNGSGQDLN